MLIARQRPNVAAVGCAVLVAAGIALAGCAAPVEAPAEDNHEAADHHDEHGNHNLSPPDQEPAEQPEGPTPSEVRIPDIEVTSELLHLGLQEDGSAEVPEDYDLASWYESGGSPGDGRPTVLLGHVDSTDGPAIFADVHHLSEGDQIEVVDSDGEVALYETDDIQVHPRDDFPTFEVFGNAREDVLRLVTCTGDFDPDDGSYTDNLIVFASRVDS